MSDSTKSSMDSGTLNSDRLSRNVSQDQQLEGHIQAGEDQGQMLIDEDEQENAAGGLGNGYRADPSTPDIGEPGSPGSDVP